MNDSIEQILANYEYFDGALFKRIIADGIISVKVEIDAYSLRDDAWHRLELNFHGNIIWNWGNSSTSHMIVINWPVELIRNDKSVSIEFDPLRSCPSSEIMQEMFGFSAFYISAEKLEIRKT